MKDILTECNCHVDFLLPYKPFPLEPKCKVNLFCMIGSQGIPTNVVTEETSYSSIVGFGGIYKQDCGFGAICSTGAVW